METIASLAGQPKLLTALMLSATDSDPPDRVVEVLRGLRQDHRAKLEEFADLASAVCLVWDEPERFGAEEDVPVNLEEVSRVFDYFARNANHLKLDPRELPAELLVYVVDGDLSEREVAWAAGRNATAGWTWRHRSRMCGTWRTRITTAAARARTAGLVLPNIVRAQAGIAATRRTTRRRLGKLGGVPSAVCRAPSPALAQRLPGPCSSIRREGTLAMHGCATTRVGRA